MPEFLTTVDLVCLVFAATVTLWLDARQRRIDRQVAKALPVSEAANLPSIRRLEAGSRWPYLFRLVDYKPGIAYDFHPAYVLLAGAIAAAAILYANGVLQFSNLYAYPVAAIVAILVVRGLFGWQRHRLAGQLFRQLPDTVQLASVPSKP